MSVVDICKTGARDTISDYLSYKHPFAFELNFQNDSSRILSDNAFIRQTGTRVWMNSLWPSLDAGHDDDKAVEENDIAGSWDWLISHNATIIQTDRPAALLKYLRSRKWHG